MGGIMDNTLKLIMGAIIVILIILVGAFALSSASNQSASNATITPTPTATPTAAPTTTVTPTQSPSATPAPSLESGVKLTEFGYYITYPEFSTYEVHANPDYVSSNGHSKPPLPPGTH